MTDIHYAQFNQLIKDYPQIRVIAQPCNQFGKQEPKEGEELYNHITTTLKPDMNGWVFLKRADVKGSNKTPLFEFLTNHPNTIGGMILGNGVLWNFEKFLVDFDGIPVKRWRSHINPTELRSTIDDILNP